MSAYLSYLYRCGEKTGLRADRHLREPPRRKNVRAIRVRVLNRAEITKYKALYPESVYLSTVDQESRDSGTAASFESLSMCPTSVGKRAVPAVLHLSGEGCSLADETDTPFRSGCDDPCRWGFSRHRG